MNFIAILRGDNECSIKDMNNKLPPDSWAFLSDIAISPNGKGVATSEFTNEITIAPNPLLVTKSK